MGMGMGMGMGIEMGIWGMRAAVMRDVEENRGGKEERSYHIGDSRYLGVFFPSGLGGFSKAK